MPLTPRQRVLDLLTGRTPDRIPTDYWSTEEFNTRFCADLGCADAEAMWDKLHIDAPRTVEPRQIREHHPDDPRATLWGTRVREMRYATGVYRETETHPLAHAACPADVHAWRWPSPDDFDYGPITNALRRDDRTYVHARELPDGDVNERAGRSIKK